MKSPIDDFDAEQQRLATLIGLADDVATLQDDGLAYCVIGRHEVPRDQVKASPRGSNVCRACQQTPRGKTEMADFDPCA